jgi:hypothetical protein
MFFRDELKKEILKIHSIWSNGRSVGDHVWSAYMIALAIGFLADAVWDISKTITDYFKKEVA